MSLFCVDQLTPEHEACCLGVGLMLNIPQKPLFWKDGKGKEVLKGS